MELVECLSYLRGQCDEAERAATAGHSQKALDIVRIAAVRVVEELPKPVKEPAGGETQSTETAEKGQ